MTLTVFKAGNSLALTVPAELALRLNIHEGDRVVPQLEESKITYIPIKKATNRVSPEFKKWLTSFEKRYGRALAELAKK